MSTASRQHQDGENTNFASRAGGGKDRPSISNRKRRQLYAEQAGNKFKSGADVNEDGWMSVCHCNHTGTCSVCVEERKNAY